MQGPASAGPNAQPGDAQPGNAQPGDALPAASRTQPTGAPGNAPAPLPAPSPAVLSVEATLCRSHGGAREILAPGALVRPGDALFLELRLTQPAYVYVLNEDAAGRVVALFPLAGLDLRNPLGPDRWHRLPGSQKGSVQDWQMGGGPGREGFLVIASRTPVAATKR